MRSIISTVVLLTMGTVANAQVDSRLITCDSVYALCSKTNCTKNLNGISATCDCPIYKGVNVGTTSCETRALAAEKMTPFSEYAPLYLLAGGMNRHGPVQKTADYPEQSCNISSNEMLQYADCWNVQGVANKTNTIARFHCPIILVSGDKGFWMQASNCPVGASMCQQFGPISSPVVINGAGKAAGLVVMGEGMNAYHQQLSPNYFCPVGNSVSEGANKVTMARANSENKAANPA